MQSITRPLVWLGAYSPGALALPPAEPTPAQLYAPRGVFLDDDYLIVADSGNHRIMIWRGLPNTDRQPADVVLGQPDFYSEGPRAGGRGPENGLHLPTGVLVIDGQLLVADAWHHRILIWDRVPDVSDAPPDRVLGQDSFAAIEPNRGGAVDGSSLYWPYGISWIQGWLYVADTGNRRVLGWRGLPKAGQPADLVLGQPNATTNDENRGAAAAANSFRWPHAIAGDGQTLYVADAGNHRILGWTPPPEQDRPADLVLGQPDMTTAREMPHAPPGPQRLRFPYSIVLADGRLVVADTADNRVLIWNTLPRSGAFAAADAVLGQPDFGGNGENRWLAVERDTLCWPYGLHLHRQRLAITDSGNNRVMIWEIG